MRRIKVLFIVILVSFLGGAVAKEKSLAIQKRSLIVKDGHFYPETLHLFEGESLHLMIGNFMGHSTCVASEGHQFFVNVSPGNVVEQVIEFKKEGDFYFSCPGLKSKLTVLVRPKPILLGKKSSLVSRSPSSIPDGVWVPKNNSSEEGAW